MIWNRILIAVVVKENARPGSLVKIVENQKEYNENGYEKSEADEAEEGVDQLPDDGSSLGGSLALLIVRPIGFVGRSRDAHRVGVGGFCHRFQQSPISCKMTPGFVVILESLTDI